MAQCFGRVNRFGGPIEAEVDVVHPAKFDEKNPRDQRRAVTLALLQRLNGSASPNAIRDIPAEDRRAPLKRNCECALQSRKHPLRSHVTAAPLKRDGFERPRGFLTRLLSMRRSGATLGGAHAAKLSLRT